MVAQNPHGLGSGGPRGGGGGGGGGGSGGGGGGGGVNVLASVTHG